MKQGKSMITFVILALGAAIAIYFSYYVFNSLNEPYRTVQVYTYTAHDSVAAEGLVVREARILPAQSGILEITRAEGEKVGKGQQIALVYRDTQAQADQTAIEELQMEIDLLEDAIAKAGELDSAARLDEDILQAVVTLRSSYALGDCTQLRTQVLGVKSAVLKRGYTYGDDLTSADLPVRLHQLQGELDVLTRQSARATTRVTAPVPGVFSALVDGYDSYLTPESLEDLTPTSLQELIDRPAGEDSGSMGKLITDQTWHFAANLPQTAAERLEEGDTATLRFTGELNQDVEMTVTRIGATENGKTLVVFSSNRYLTSTTLLRHQTAELIFESWSGLRIPKEALHLVEEQTDSDSSSGSASTSSGSTSGSSSAGGSSAPTVHRMGVYALVNGRTEFREVEIVHEGSNYYVVHSVGAGRKILRAGDAVITEATGLQDGMRLEG